MVQKIIICTHITVYFYIWRERENYKANGAKYKQLRIWTKGVWKFLVLLLQLFYNFEIISKFLNGEVLRKQFRERLLLGEERRKISEGGQRRTSY